jgi:DNA-binding MarR family transcriptional regulator
MSSPSDDSLGLADEMRPVLQRLYRRFRRENEDLDLGISPIQRLLMATIAENPGLGVGDLAQREKLRGPTISGHVKSLEATGLVKRLALDPVDRRRSSLFLTDKGSELLEEVRRRRRDWLAGQLDRLTPDGRDAIRAALAPLNEIGQ